MTFILWFLCVQPLSLSLSLSLSLFSLFPSEEINRLFFFIFYIELLKALSVLYSILC
ncbi:hypothetical protein ACMBCM_05200 [Spiroplasma sp. K1]